jgi:hypothetical protein
VTSAPAWLVPRRSAAALLWVVVRSFSCHQRSLSDEFQAQDTSTCRPAPGLPTREPGCQAARRAAWLARHHPGSAQPRARAPCAHPRGEGSSRLVPTLHRAVHARQTRPEHVRADRRADRNGECNGPSSQPVPALLPGLLPAQLPALLPAPLPPLLPGLLPPCRRRGPASALRAGWAGSRPGRRHLFPRPGACSSRVCC